MTPRSARGATPRPVIRGPQGGKHTDNPVLNSEEEARAEKAFHRVDKMRQGEVDVSEFLGMCESMELPMDPGLVNEWVGGRDKGQGLKMDDFKILYAKVLAAQSPAVRQVHNGCDMVRLSQVNSSEAYMRKAYDRYARNGKLAVEQLSEVFQYLRFPDHHGDGFDRFVGEWVVLAGKEWTDSVNFHEFASSINLLVDFCDKQRGPDFISPCTR